MSTIMVDKLRAFRAIEGASLYLFGVQRDGFVSHGGYEGREVVAGTFRFGGTALPGTIPICYNTNTSVSQVSCDLDRLSD